MALSMSRVTGEEERARGLSIRTGSLPMGIGGGSLPAISSQDSREGAPPKSALRRCMGRPLPTVDGFGGLEKVGLEPTLLLALSVALTFLILTGSLGLSVSLVVLIS